MSRRLAARLLGVGSDERGIALPVALGILFLAAGLSTVAAKAGVIANHQSLRERSAKRALQAAGAGVDTVTYNLNIMQPNASQCPVENSTTGSLMVVGVQSNTWCQNQTEDLGDGASYTVTVSSATTLRTNGQVLYARKIISTGTVNGVKRRLFVNVRAATGEPLFPISYAAVSLTSASYGQSSTINGGVGSNGNIVLKNSDQVCGPVTPGVGKTLTVQNSASICAGYPTTPATTKFSLAPVDQTSAIAHNDNGRICGADPCTGSVSWNASTRRLDLTNSGTVTLTGDTYSLCRITLKNSSRLIIAARSTPLRIYFDSPENCGGGNNWTSMSLENTSSIVNLNTDPTTLQVLVAGSTTYSTFVDFENQGDPSQDIVMAIYAPNSTVHLENSVAIRGAVAAKTIEVKNSATLTYDNRVEDITSLNVARVFNDSDQLECTATPTSSTVAESGC